MNDSEVRIYFDMDGVLADFDRGIIELCHMKPHVQGCTSPAEDVELWDAVKQVPHFYDRLEPVKGSVEMFRTVYEKYGDDCQILTGIPKPKRGVVTAGEDKINWAHRILTPSVKVNVVYREQKPQFVRGPEDILVDDYQRNIDEWEREGGKGVLFVTPSKALEELRKITCHLL